jgi:hypothetical protein
MGAVVGSIVIEGARALIMMLRAVLRTPMVRRCIERADTDRNAENRENQGELQHHCLFRCRAAFGGERRGKINRFEVTIRRRLPFAGGRRRDAVALQARSPDLAWRVTRGLSESVAIAMGAVVDSIVIEGARALITMLRAVLRASVVRRCIERADTDRNAEDCENQGELQHRCLFRCRAAFVGDRRVKIDRSEVATRHRLASLSVGVCSAAD